MIVREIKEHPEFIENFDWFNDYKNTRAWAVRMGYDDLVGKLDDGYREWIGEGKVP